MPADGTEGTGRGAPADACARARDLLPLAVGGTLPAGERPELQSHLEGCDACRDEEAFLRRAFQARSRAPDSLTGSVLAALDEEAAPDGSVPSKRSLLRAVPSLAWGLPTAAAVVLALGIGLLRQGGEVPESIWSLALEPTAESWGQEEWMVAGTALLDEVSEETLLALLDELNP